MMSPEHIAHPYPTDQEKSVIMAETGIELKQLTNWFVNNRKRYWKPRVEARLQQQAKANVPVKKVPTTPAVARRSYVINDVTKLVPDSPPMVNASAFVSFDRSRSPRAVSIGSSSFTSEVDDDASLVSNETSEDTASEVSEDQEVDADADAESGDDDFTARQDLKASKKRAREEDENVAFRPKYLRQSLPTWRDACRSAENVYDRELPSLEEASHLFGFAVN